MKRLSLPLVLLVAIAGAGCHAPVTVTTQAGKVAYAADQVVQRINELEAAAIQANANGALPTATTRLIVEFCVSADTTLKATPDGWQASVQAAWSKLKGQIPTPTNSSLAAVWATVDLMLASLGG